MIILTQSVLLSCGGGSHIKETGLLVVFLAVNFKESGTLF